MVRQRLWQWRRWSCRFQSLHVRAKITSPLVNFTGLDQIWRRAFSLLFLLCRFRCVSSSSTTHTRECLTRQISRQAVWALVQASTLVPLSDFLSIMSDDVIFFWSSPFIIASINMIPPKFTPLFFSNNHSSKIQKIPVTPPYIPIKGWISIQNVT